MRLINVSVSRDAVPFPMAMASILYAFTSVLIFFIACVASFLGSWGYIVSLCTKPPCLSKHTILQPVLKPGSIAKIVFSPNGGLKSNWFKFFAKTAIAVVSAFSFALDSASLANAGANNLLNASLIASSIWVAQWLSDLIILFSI